MGLCSGGLIIGRIFASEIWGANFREGLLMEGLIIGILRYFYSAINKQNLVKRKLLGMKYVFDVHLLLYVVEF